MSVRLGGAARQGYIASVVDLFSLYPERPRKQLAKDVALRSVRVRLSDILRPGRKNAATNGSSQDRPELLDGFHNGNAPLRIRPALVVLNIVTLILLGIMGFHPRGQDFVPFNDKILHFVCFFFATALFYCIWDVDEPARRIWVWRHMPLLLTFAACFAAGGLGSEIVQSLLPYKTFQWGDVVANFLGSGLGLLVSYHAERRFRLRREIERLYEPLDQELYGDEDDDDASDLEGRGGSLSNYASHAAEPWKSADADEDAAARAQGNSKRVHFTGEEATAAPSRANDSIFSLADEDEDEENDHDTEHTNSKRADVPPSDNVWRDAR